MCPYAPDILHADKLVDLLAVRVNYTCHPGYMFPDRTREKQVECECEETWSAGLLKCQGK